MTAQAESDPKKIKQAIADQARALGFDAVSFAPAYADPQAAAHLRDYVGQGLHGEMGWMAERLHHRESPQGLWPEARSVIILGSNYGPGLDPLALHDKADRGVISVYARNKDYHDLVKKRLKQLGRWMADNFGAGLKVFVDTAPVMEKPLAARSQMGWQGKHTNLVSREFGSWLFLSEIFTTLDLPPDPPQRDLCGSCSSCRDACPTGAITGPYRIDPRLCISYLTIEHKGPIPADLRRMMGNRIYGCDDCLAVCPWNKFAVPTKEPDFLPRAELIAPRLADLAQLDDAAFREIFAGSPIKRIGRDRFVRNVLTAIGNSGDCDLAAIAEGLLADGSPLVRGAAIWALSRLLDRESFDALRARHLPEEAEADARAEWG